MGKPGSRRAAVVRGRELRASDDQYRIDHTLTGAADFQSWNGSLWTLSYEFTCYVGAGLLMGVGWVKRRSVLVPVSILILTTIAQLTGVPFPWPFLPRLAGFFAAGMLVWTLRDRLTVIAPTLACLLTVLLVWTNVDPRALTVLLPLPLAYALLSLGALLPVRAGSRHDISYGLYIYAFPVQQMLFQTAGQSLGLVSAVVAFLATLPLAWASWLWVERPVIREIAKSSPPRAAPVASRD